MKFPFADRFLTLAFVTLSLCGGAHAAEVLRVKADTWMPFNGAPSGEPRGYVLDILKEVFSDKGIAVEYELEGWPEALAQVQAGSIDAVIGANETEAKGLVLPKESVGEPRMGLFTPKDIEWRYDNLQSLRQVKLGVIEAYSYWESLDDYIKTAPKKNIHMLSGETPLVDGIKLLDTKKIDVLAETFPVFIWAVKNSGRSVSDYRVAFKQAGEPIYVAFAPNDKGRAYAAQLDAGIQELRSSGKLETLLKRYGLSDWTK